MVHSCVQPDARWLQDVMALLWMTKLYQSVSKCKCMCVTRDMTWGARRGAEGQSLESFYILKSSFSPWCCIRLLLGEACWVVFISGHGLLGSLLRSATRFLWRGRWTWRGGFWGHLYTSDGELRSHFRAVGRVPVQLLFAVGVECKLSRGS